MNPFRQARDPRPGAFDRRIYNRQPAGCTMFKLVLTFAVTGGLVGVALAVELTWDWIKYGHR
jgi:hypothetical protein